MKYLDERIVLTVTVAYPYPDGGIYKYCVYEYDEGSQSEEDEIIFTGNYYYGRTSTRIDFDLTDIIRSRKYVSSYPTVNYTISSYEGGLIKRYKIMVWTSDGTVTSQWTEVAMIYRYPNFKGWLTDGSRTYDVMTNSEDVVMSAIQGSRLVSDGIEVNYLPHYPLSYTTEYAYNQCFLTSNNLQEFQLDFYQPGFDDYYPISLAQYDSRTTATHILLQDLVDWSYVNTTKDATLYLMPEDDVYYPIAKFDSCKKRYYLQWEDRYGGFQSQGFNDFSTFSETYDTTETQNYKNERKKSFIQVQPKWKINSGWIPEEWFYIYESILVSPILFLYDTKYDKSYNVIVNTNYTEKTYKNEKKLLNMSLELEEISKQNIIY